MVIGLMEDFVRACVSAISRRGFLLVVLNWLFFGVIVVGAFLAQGGYVRVFEWPLGEEISHEEMGNVPFMVVSIFLFNLAVSGFVLVTLSGLAFFVLPVVFLLVRAALWGVLLNRLPPPWFLAAFPTLILEGEGYVLAGVAGVGLGLSWLKPEWAYGREELSRLDSVRRALKDCARIYVLVAMFLFVAAVVETATIYSLGTVS